MPLKIAVRKNREEEEKDDLRRREGGIRFLVETEFSKLGSFQFDGFSQVKERRFDLVIRTSQPQPQGFCAEIMRLFKNSLHDVGYNGQININQQADFIKINSDASGLNTAEGLFI